MVTKIGRRRPQHVYLAQWRESRALSVERLADLLEVDRSTVWRWETGRRTPTPEQLAQIAHALNCDAADLWRMPDTRPDLNAIMKDAPDDVFDAVAEMARRLAKRA